MSLLEKIQYMFWKKRYNRLRNRMFNQIIKNMKKLLILFAILLTGCKCMLGQIPPQYLYAGADCQVVVPSYVDKLIVSDNCELASVLQTPEAGYILDNINRSVTVTLRATDVSGNFREVSFGVFLVDTIKPVITVDTSLMSYRLNQIENLYNAADEIIAQMMDEADRAIRDTVLFPASEYPGLLEVYEDSTYHKRIMLTWTAPGHALTGYGNRYWTFIQPFDTLIFNKW